MFSVGLFTGSVKLQMDDHYCEDLMLKNGYK